MEELRSRNAVVTGASRGLGAQLVRALAREGVNLALAARSSDALETDTLANG
jgi:short-subunit dehydrogenase